MKLCASIYGLLLALLAVCGPGLWAQDGIAGAFSAVRESAAGTGWFSQLAAADFDQDSQPDGAVLSQSGWWNGQRIFRIDLHVTTGENATLSFLSAEPSLGISAIDINRDGAPDIVVERPFTRERLQVYLNDGHGTFQRVENNSLPLPRDSSQICRAAMDPVDTPMALLLGTRGFELVSEKASGFTLAADLSAASFWPEALLAQSGPRAPSSPRAPPAVALL